MESVDIFRNVFSFFGENILMFWESTLGEAVFGVIDLIKFYKTTKEKKNGFSWRRCRWQNFSPL